MENQSINLVFDRTFFSEENYCRLGYKEYSFTDIYNTLLDRLANMDFEIYYLNLYLSDSNEFENRLHRNKKADVKYAKFNKQNSINQQNTYLEMANEIKEKYSNINVINIDNCKTEDEVKQELMDVLGLDK